MDHLSQGLTRELEILVEQARQKGVRFWSKDGQLHFRAPRGVLTSVELEAFRSAREPLIAYFEAAQGSGPEAVSKTSAIRRCPLAFSQLAHWRLYHLSERQAIRQIASAVRVRGRLDLSALRRSLGEICRRHDALRARIVMECGSPIQEISEVGPEIVTVDMTSLHPDRRDARVLQLIDELILEPIDVGLQPLFGVYVLELARDESVIVVVMEHMISDARSMGIFMGELFSAYGQVLRHRPIVLPHVQFQFTQFASVQRAQEQALVKANEQYWRNRLMECPRCRFPSEQLAVAESTTGWGVVPVLIDGGLKGELSHWCRSNGTTLAMGFLTAYVALLLRWCRVSDMVVKYQSDGRGDIRTANMIGYLSSVLYLRVDLFPEDTLADLMKRLTKEYCNAYEHADHSYIAAQPQTPEFTRNSCFNWVPKGDGVDLAELPQLAGSIELSPIHFEHPMLKHLEIDNEPSILLYEMEDKIAGGMQFPLDRFSSNTMARFCRTLLSFVEMLVRNPVQRVTCLELLPSCHSSCRLDRT